MALNTTKSNVSTTAEELQGTHAIANFQMAFSQTLVCVLLYVNFAMIFTFFKKEAFRENTRYILFAHMLVVDTMQLALVDLAVMIVYCRIFPPDGVRILLSMLMFALSFHTPLTLTAMCLERYVAICMPLRHADISTVKAAWVSIGIVWVIGWVPTSIDLFIVIATKRPPIYTEGVYVFYEIMFRYPWQYILRSSICLFYFAVTVGIVAFTYIQIIRVARSASADKNSTSKASNTITLHAFQLVPCILVLICPLIEAEVKKIDAKSLSSVRYFDFIVFTLSPRCLSPLIYGLRDEKFSRVLKYYIICGLTKTVVPVTVDV
ncbi:odorant receptor 131-2-like [Acipenser oxyrinchus oxyrinchus]|uniref:Odorant receptor 131-2-like n=1 Tax=Acipenser oxyrinchus oxyrinchus TaxID=40147 RepID=A0AAD8G8E9_ACIOX|nr:odorant receptor 131-2-like [Acipenser oxyrinchus oxyrinchus]